MHSTLGFSIEGVRRQRARWPRLGAILALAAGALCILLDPALSELVLAALVAVAAGSAWTGWRSGARRQSGCLRVDAAGGAHWHPAGAGMDAAAPLVLAPRRWQLGADEIWLLAHGLDGQRLHLRMGRRDCDEARWRALRRWLVWSGRAGPKAVHA